MTLENIIRRQKYPCANRERGCLELFSIEHIAKHHAGCVYGKINCPFHSKCSWNGLKSDFKEHVGAAHPKSFIQKQNLHDPFLTGTLAVLSCFGELFTYRKQKKDGRLYCAVQLIGTSSEASKYKCAFTLRAANGIEQISNTFSVQGYSEDFEIIFKSGKCLNLDEATINLFVVDEKLNLIVTLSTV
jgi:hypothetical protein